MTRDGFRSRFEAVYGVKISARMLQDIQQAEKVRDSVMHGTGVSASDARGALRAILDYCESLRSLTLGVAGFSPFDDMRGFKGRAEPLDDRTTLLVLRGLGF